MYFVLGISVLLAAMLLVNGAASMAAWLLWRAGRKRIDRWTAATSSQTLFLLRIAPAALSFVAVLLLGTAFVLYEPRSGYEEVSWKLGLLAGLAFFGVLMAAVRAIGSWRATVRLTSEWMAQAQPVQLRGVPIPAFQFEHRFPLIAVIGITRPKLFIAQKVFASLTSEELSAALQHEAGHIASHDNLRRGLMRVCRDLLCFLPISRSLDRAWMEASESAADDHATIVGGNTNVELASALVKIARMVPAGVRPAVPAGAFLITENNSQGFRQRVRRLLQIERNKNTPTMLSARRLYKVIVPVVLLILVAVSAGHQQLFANAHLLIEHLVHFLR